MIFNITLLLEFYGLWNLFFLPSYIGEYTKNKKEFRLITKLYNKKYGEGWLTNG